MLSRLEEKKIIEGIRAGDINLFAVIVKEYSQKILWFVRQRVQNPDDAQDIVQNSFVKFYKALDRFDSQKPIYPYLLTISRNEISQFFRDNPKYISLNEELELPQVILQENIDFTELSIRDEYKSILKSRAEGYSYEEIAEKLGKPINTVKTLIRRAKIELREAYEKK